MREVQFVSHSFDRLEHWVRERFERQVVWAAAIGFLIHLGLILLVRLAPELQTGILADLDRNFLHAIYTPFTFILFYEVLALVVALPNSHTSSIGKQYQIISLIVVRRVFKDIGQLSDLESLMSDSDTAAMIFVDMCGAVAMFLLVTLFARLRTFVRKAPFSRDLDTFIRLKKMIALLLCAVLTTLAAYTLCVWLGAVFQTDAKEVPIEDLDSFFFPEFFEFMIFTDVFLLIVSMAYYERYEFLFRNAGFVISTVLLRCSLATPKPYDVALGLLAMVYGLAVLGVFALFTRNGQVHDADPSR